MKVFCSFILFIILVNVDIYSKENNNSNNFEARGIIRGIVVDSLSNAGMAYATVAVINSETSKVIEGAITKNKGDFIITDLPFGQYDIKFSFVGYHNEIVTGVNLTKENYNLELDKVKLKSKSYETNDILVSADKDNISYNIDKKIINISSNPNARGGKIADALQNVSSVNVDAEGNVSLRGSTNFQVLIDGKPSPVAGNDALKMIPADVVENIEIITNPSAKYDPDGTAGIINVVMKKMDMNGLNGILNSSAGIKDKYSADALFNYKYGDLNFYSGINYEDRTFKPRSDYTRETYDNLTDTVYLINPIINRKMIDQNFSAKAGVEYTISPSRFISFSGNVLNMHYERRLPSKLTVWTNPMSSNNYFYNDDINTIDGYYSTINTFFLQNFSKKGHKLSSTINAIIWDGGGNEVSSKAITDNKFNLIDTNLQKHQGIADSRSFLLKYKADYVYPINDNSEFEVGINFDYTQDFSDYLYQDYNILSKLWEENTGFTNNTKYYHNIYAIYSTISGSIFDFNCKLGLRAEYFNRRLEQETNSSLFKYRKVNIFPTLHLSRKFENDRQIQISYSRRVQRPDVYALNPFPDYADDYYVSVGNPGLMPEFTDSYELNYQKGYEKWFLSLQTYYRNTDNAISRVLRTKDDNKIWITSENISRKYVLGSELSANINFSKEIRINLNGNFFYNKLESDDPTIQENLGGYSMDANIMLIYNFGQNTMFQLNSYYFGPRYSIDGKIEPTYSLGFSVRQFFFDRLLTLYLTGRNVMNKVKYESVNRRDTLYNYGTMYAEGANISLGISLKINNFERKIRPEDEIERSNVGSSGGY